MVKLLWISLPKVGFLLDGCLYSSVNGLTAAGTLAVESIAPVTDLMDVPAPVPGLGPRSSAALLGTASLSGIGLSILFGDVACKRRFFWLSLAQLGDSLLFLWAWWRGEGRRFW